MKTWILPSFLVGLAVGLSGCHKPEAVQSVEWYQAHAQERSAKLTECRQNPGELAATPNCMNAERAAALADSHGHSPDLGKPVDHVLSADELLKD